MNVNRTKNEYAIAAVAQRSKRQHELLTLSLVVVRPSGAKGNAPETLPDILTYRYLLIAPAKRRAMYLECTLSYVHVLPESAGSVLTRSSKAAAKRARRRTRVRRTSDASGNAAGARQGLPADPGFMRTRAATPLGRVRASLPTPASCAWFRR